ncbi:hypothetical protein BSR28_05885 [Boudabousia liubingyangii]|uniref:hypothetical protein n=1 Tax=Boudabousia liubingyangii TaxID=1921764 RepID=UPI000939493B|nr:hypothetical protein [Boudabousia liubingyangii]OKL46950.1 hypothetical protein BSR28_05885 [Boudabousia liubingyangii]
MSFQKRTQVPRRIASILILASTLGACTSASDYPEISSSDPTAPSQQVSPTAESSTPDSSSTTPAQGSPEDQTASQEATPEGSKNNPQSDLDNYNRVTKEAVSLILKGDWENLQKNYLANPEAAELIKHDPRAKEYFKDATCESLVEQDKLPAPYKSGPEDPPNGSSGIDFYFYNCKLARPGQESSDFALEIVHDGQDWKVSNIFSVGTFKFYLPYTTPKNTVLNVASGSTKFSFAPVPSLYLTGSRRLGNAFFILPGTYHLDLSLDSKLVTLTDQKEIDVTTKSQPDWSPDLAFEPKEAFREEVKKLLAESINYCLQAPKTPRTCHYKLWERNRDSEKFEPDFDSITLSSPPQRLAGDIYGRIRVADQFNTSSVSFTIKNARLVDDHLDANVVWN